MEPDQVLRVSVKLEGNFTVDQFFYAKMSKDGRILIPLLTLALICREVKPALAGQIFDVTIDPA